MDKNAVMPTQLEKKILELLQRPLKICRRPFVSLARQAGCTPGQCLERIASLKAAGYIRRFSATVNYAALGRTAALVAASVPQKKLDKVISAINRLHGVSHHYMRKHVYNLWFTLQGRSPRNIQHTLGQLSRDTGVRFYAMPAIQVYKLDARFNPRGPSQRDFRASDSIRTEPLSVRVSLTQTERKSLRLLQDDFPLAERPFDSLAEKSNIPDFEQITQRLMDKKVIRRISVVAAYRRLGYKANVMTCFVLPPDKIERAALWLSARPAVSHCYQRRTLDGWPYNLFAMIHAGRLKDIKQFIREFTRRYAIDQWVLLPTIKELKKQPVMYQG